MQLVQISLLLINLIFNLRLHKTISILLLVFIANTLSYAQYFQGSFSLGTNDTIIFKIKPVGGNITTKIVYMEFAFRYETTQASSLSCSNPVSNTLLFGSTLNIVSFPPNYTSSGKTYFKFVHNTGALSQITFNQGIEYEVFKIKLSQSPTNSMNIEMSSDLTGDNYAFALINAADQLIDPSTNNQLYGTGFYVSGTGHYLPLLGISTPSAPIALSPVSYCQNQTATALEANGSSLLWYTNATGGVGSTTAPIPSTLTNGTFNYYVSQTINNIESPRSQITVIVNSSPTAPTTNSTYSFCQGAIGNSLTAVGDSLLWYQSITGGVGVSNAPIPNTSTAGIQHYFVSQTINGCESPRTDISVNINPAPLKPTSDTLINYCQNTTASVLSATGVNLIWYTIPNGGTGNTSAPLPSTSSAGTQDYYVSQTLNGCESNRTHVVVIINPTPVAPTVTTPISYCLNSTASLLNATGSNLLWYTTSTGGTGSSIAPTPSTSTIGNTQYYVTQTINNCEGQRANITVNVIDRISPLFTLSSSVCSRGEVATLPTTSNNGISGTWMPSTISNLSSANYLFTPNPAACANNFNLAITVFPSPYQNTRYQTVNASSNINTTISAVSLNNASYLWTPSIGLNNATIYNPVFNYNQTIEYQIQIKTAEGCKITDTILVKVNAQVPSYILVADAFSPNGDGKNDFLIPNLKGINKLIYFKVFDRWGQLVFQTATIGKGWDGFFKGTKQPVDVYVWIAEGIDNNDKVIKKTGNSILIK